MKQRTKIILLFCSILFVVSAIGFLSWEKNKHVDISLVEDIIITREPLPSSIEFVNIKDNSSQSEKVQNGKVLLVYLLGGCKACDVEINALNEIQEEMSSGTKIFGIVLEKDRNSYLAPGSSEIKFPILLDKNNELQRNLGIKYFPLNLLVVDGVIIKKWVGIKDKQELLENLEIKNTD